jgi:hypothetical protein|tara:strand:- start:112 stop:369 length:258 start_codon:yes stop_codon:yes gene_type:complete
MDIRESIKRVLREFQFDELDRKPFRDGELVLEMVTGDEYPKYMIIYEVGDLDSGEGEGEIIAELGSQFFDGHMAQTIMDYLLTKE